MALCPQRVRAAYCGQASNAVYILESFLMLPGFSVEVAAVAKAAVNAKQRERE